jgi:hypothetical protein
MCYNESGSRVSPGIQGCSNSLSVSPQEMTLRGPKCPWTSILEVPMSSQRRIAASQANGRLSHGPKTPERKQRSSLNAMGHGLRRHRRPARRRCAGLPRSHAPIRQALLPDDVEYTFIKEMAAAYWRQRRGWCIETTLLKEVIDAQSPGEHPHRMTAAFRILLYRPVASGHPWW